MAGSMLDDNFFATIQPSLNLHAGRCRAVYGSSATEEDKLIALSGESGYNPMLYRIWHRESSGFAAQTTLDLG